MQSEAAGPRPDGHGLFAAIPGWSVGQELSFDTLTLSLVSKLTKFHLFSFFTYSNYNIDKAGHPSYGLKLSIQSGAQFGL